MNIKEWFSRIDKRMWFLLLLLFLLGFAVRGHNLKYDLFFEFDTYFHARMTSYILQDGVLPLKDPLAYWQIGYSNIPAVGPFFWMFSAAIYKIFTLGAPYNQALWIQFVKLLPALFGALTAVALFFFGKEIYNKKAGYAMAFTAAIIPAFVYRTIAGFFEDDCLGFLWMVIGLVFYVRAIKNPSLEKKNLMNALLAGIFFGIMSMTWSFFIVLVLIVVLHFIFAFFKIYKEFSKKELKAFIILFAITMGIFAPISLSQDSAWITKALSLVANSMPFLGSMAIYLVYLFLLISFAGILILTFLKKDEENAKTGLPFYLMLILYFSFIFLLIILSDPGQVFSHKFRPPDSIFANTIGEESFGFPTWGYKFNALIILPWAVLLLIPYMLFKEKKSHLSIIIFFWVWITLFMAFYKLQYTYTFGLPIAAAAGVIISEFFNYFKKPKLLETRTVALAIGFLLLTGVAAGAFFAKENPPTIETMPEWKEAIYWAKDNTEDKAKFFNWWNWGHWISFLGGKQVFLDNRNSDSEGASNFGQFVTTSDMNKALKIMKKYEPDYLILDSDLLSMAGSMLVYGYNTLNLNSVPELSGKLPGYFGAVMDCSKSGNAYSCGGNVIPENQFNNLPNKWTAQPNQIQEEKVPLWVYKTQNNSSIVITGYATNFSTISKLWFHDEETMKYFEEVFSNKRIKIFKVKKEAIE